MYGRFSRPKKVTIITEVVVSSRLVLRLKCMISKSNVKLTSVRQRCSVIQNKIIISLGFSDILNNQGLGKCYQPRPLARLITLQSINLDYSGYHKKLIQILFIIYKEGRLLCSDKVKTNFIFIIHQSQAGR